MSPQMSTPRMNGSEATRPNVSTLIWPILSAMALNRSGCSMSIIDRPTAPSIISIGWKIASPPVMTPRPSGASLAVRSIISTLICEALGHLIFSKSAHEDTRQSSAMA